MATINSYNVCFLGRTGNGKSSLINEIWGTHFPTDPLLSCTKEMQTVTKKDLKNFTIDAAEYSKEQFFTMKSIRKEGFVSKIDDIGFDDYFYSALLRSNKAIRYNKVGGTFLFAHIDRQVKFIEVGEYLIKGFRRISIQKLLDIILEEYGIKYDRTDLICRVNNTGMYYDRIMEKVYINKEEYYEDI